MLGRAAQLGGANRARAIGSCHRASRTEHAQPPSRAEQTLRSVRLLGVIHKYTPTRIPARFMCATHMLSQSEARDARWRIPQREYRQAEPEQLIGLLSRTEPSPSDRVTPPSKPNRACKPPSRARADPPLGLLGLIPGLCTADCYVTYN